MFKRGDWIRFYSNSLRGGGEVRHLGKITQFRTNKDGDVVGYRVENAVMIYEINRHDVIGKVEVDGQQKIIIRDCPESCE